MAAPGVTVKRAERALQQIVESVLALAERLQIDPVAIPTQGRDLNYLHADQLEAIAENLTRMVSVPTTAPAIKTPEPEDLNLLTKAQLVDRLAELGLTDIDKDDHLKDELIVMVQNELSSAGKG
jgi:hypothetical protein